MCARGGAACNGGNLESRRCATLRSRGHTRWCVGVGRAPEPPPPYMLSLSHPLRRACPGDNYKYSRATCGSAACAAVISTIDDTTLSSLKTGFIVSPRPRAGGSVYALQARVNECALVCGRACKRGCGDTDAHADAIGATRAGLRRAARQRWAKGVCKQHNSNEL